MDQRDFLTQSLERLFEISGAYVLAGAHLEGSDEDTPEAEAERVATISAVMNSIGFDDSDVLDVAALIGAKAMVSFYAVVRGVFDPELTDHIWQLFVQLNAEHRVNLAVEALGEDE